MKFGHILIGFLLAGLFAVAFINGGLILGQINSPNQTIANNPDIINLTNEISPQLTQSYDDLNQTESAVSDSEITLTSGSGGAIIDSINGVWKTMKKAPTAIYLSIAYLIKSNLFGDSSYEIIFSVLGAILTIIIILAIWRLVRIGD